MNDDLIRRRRRRVVRIREADNGFVIYSEDRSRRRAPRRTLVAASIEEVTSHVAQLLHDPAPAAEAVPLRGWREERGDPDEEDFGPDDPFDDDDDDDGTFGVLIDPDGGA